MSFLQSKLVYYLFHLPIPHYSSLLHLAFYIFFNICILLQSIIHFIINKIFNLQKITKISKANLLFTLLRLCFDDSEPNINNNPNIITNNNNFNHNDLLLTSNSLDLHLFHIVRHNFNFLTEVVTSTRYEFLLIKMKRYLNSFINLISFNYFVVNNEYFDNYFLYETFEFFIKNKKSTQLTKSHYFYKNKKNKKILIFIHGGGYILGSSFAFSGLFLKLFRHYNNLQNNLNEFNLFLMEYRQFPEHNIDESLNDILKQLDFIVNELKYNCNNIVIAGDSAGCNLLLRLLKDLYKLQQNNNTIDIATINNNYKNKYTLQEGNNNNQSITNIKNYYLNKLKDKINFKKIILLSPWLDLTTSTESIGKKENYNEIVMPYQFLRLVKEFNLPLMKNQLAIDYSPYLWEDLKFLENKSIFYCFGEKERFVDEQCEFLERLRKLNIELTVEVGKEMCHDYWLLYNFLDEAKECLEKMILFMKDESCDTDNNI
ncbi:hypothetical protein ABK040_003703 [Willaertia magna]